MMPHASEIERRAATEQQLHQDVTIEAWAKARRWAEIRARQAEAVQARAEATAAPPEDTVPAVPAASVPPPSPRPAPVTPAADPECANVDDQELVLENLTREQVLDSRTRAAHDHQIVHDHIARYGEHSAQRLFTRAFVATVQRLSGLRHLDLGYTLWGQA
ncbi:hypothetical protein [Streptomyces telluris]|uniref:Uncharacterized protein n=1 Tax=Streptomyces telluris TaxID=2720021 RepID=A0A9X2LIZ0_9ACTN|nr:hypothetical protein [Streptomyces telluris]MCQ8772075.1 hypothetical protein [Streptomyces telluris]NJP76637.1 hypothetical protein [Streptomyces telluris]